VHPPPVSPREASRRRSQNRLVERSTRALHLSAKDLQLVSEHDDLEIPGGLVLPTWTQDLKQPTNHQVRTGIQTSAPPPIDGSRGYETW
jgi:hypothetical protein